MKYLSVTIIVFLILSSCKTSRTIYENPIEMELVNRQFVIGSDSTSFKEMRLYYGNGAMQIAQIMFDNHGRWDQAVYPEGNQIPLLIWEKVDLLSNGIEYDVFADGIETNTDMYAALMVFDNKNNDALSESSIERDTLTKHFMILAETAIDSSGFYEQYWKMVDPQHWEFLERVRKEKRIRENMGFRVSEK